MAFSELLKSYSVQCIHNIILIIQEFTFNLMFSYSFTSTLPFCHSFWLIIRDVFYFITIYKRNMSWTTQRKLKKRRKILTVKPTTNMMMIFVFFNFFFVLFYFFFIFIFVHFIRATKYEFNLHPTSQSSSNKQNKKYNKIIRKKEEKTTTTSRNLINFILKYIYIGT